MYEVMFNHPGAFFADLERLRREFDDVYESTGMSTGIRAVAPGAFPALNVGNTPESVEIYAFAPGLDTSKVDVVVDRGVLTISGERPSTLPDPAEPKGVSVYSRERASGSFRRAISLPEDADPGNVQADYRDGVLHVRVARRAAAQPTRIAIQ
jgi:HSP20 family protein